MTKLALEIYSSGLGDAAESATGPQGVLAGIGTFNFLYTELAIFVLCIAIMFAFSFAGEAPSPEKLEGLTYQTTHTAEVDYTRVDVVVNCIVVAFILCLYVFFSPLFF